MQGIVSKWKWRSPSAAAVAGGNTPGPLAARAHRGREIKDPVAVDPAKYIKESPELGKMLSNLRLGGKQVFLLTNSLYDYTECVMRHLLGEGWAAYFDIVICGARKPGFLLDPYLPLFQVLSQQ